MQSIVYTTNFYCNLCKRNIPIVVYGDRNSDFPSDKREENEAREMGEHYHWIDNHRRCAICGELVAGGKREEPEGLNLIDNDGQVEIHEKYVAETMDKAHGEQLLVAHNGCAQKIISESENESI